MSRLWLHQALNDSLNEFCQIIFLGNWFYWFSSLRWTAVDITAVYRSQWWRQICHLLKSTNRCWIIKDKNLDSYTKSTPLYIPPHRHTWNSNPSYTNQRHVPPISTLVSFPLCIWKTDQPILTFFLSLSLFLSPRSSLSERLEVQRHWPISTHLQTN